MKDIKEVVILWRALVLLLFPWEKKSILSRSNRVKRYYFLRPCDFLPFTGLMRDQTLGRGSGSYFYFYFYLILPSSFPLLSLSLSLFFIFTLTLRERKRSIPDSYLDLISCVEKKKTPSIYCGYISSHTENGVDFDSRGGGYVDFFPSLFSIDSHSFSISLVWY